MKGCGKMPNDKLNEHEPGSSKILDPTLDDVRKAEMRRCVAIVMAEYTYWRDAQWPNDITDSMRDMLEGHQMGAVGAASNILSRILGHKIMGRT